MVCSTWSASEDTVHAVSYGTGQDRDEHPATQWCYPPATLAAAVSIHTVFNPLSTVGVKNSSEEAMHQLVGSSQLQLAAGRLKILACVTW